MKIRLIRYPYKDYEIGEIIDLGEEKNKSMVSLQRAVWFEEEKKKPRAKKKAAATTTQAKDDVVEEKEGKPARGPDGKFVSKKETEEPKKKGFLSRLR